MQMTLCCTSTDDQSLLKAMCTIDDFSDASGSKINKNKSQVPWTLADPTHILGISFGNVERDDKINWEKQLNKVYQKIGLWKKRKLTLSRKVLVLKADILPSLLHLPYVFPMPHAFRKTFTRTVFNLFWGGYEYIKRDTIVSGNRRWRERLPKHPPKM